MVSLTAELSDAVRGKLRSSFIEQALSSMAAIEKAAKPLDRAALQTATHALRGPALYMQAHAIIEETDAIDLWSREPEPSTSLRPLISKLSEAIDALVLQPFDVPVK